MDPRTFAVERLGVGDWPSTDDSENRIISRADWDALADVTSTAVDPVCFAFDVAPDRSYASIGAAGRREDGKLHIEVIEHRRGTSWLPSRLVELTDSHENAGVIGDASGPAGALFPAITALDIEVQAVSAKDQAQAFGMFLDAIRDDEVRHLGTRELRAAVAGAARRSLGDAWAWSRKSSAVDICPLVATTLALWGSDTLITPAARCLR
jgi:hypothetical protein